MTVDPIVVAAQIVLALQTIVSREVSPLDVGVVTIGTIKAGDADNVISDTAQLNGTVRSFVPAVRTLMERRVTEIAQGVASAMRATAEMSFVPGYPSVVNDAAAIELVGAVVADVVGPSACVEMDPQAGAEDFSRVIERVPGAMFFLGVRDPVWPEERPIHSATFDLDEAALPVGASLLAGTALRFLDDSQP